MLCCTRLSIAPPHLREQATPLVVRLALYATFPYPSYLLLYYNLNQNMYTDGSLSAGSAIEAQQKTNTLWSIGLS